MEELLICERLDVLEVIFLDMVVDKSVGTEVSVMAIEQEHMNFGLVGFEKN